VGRGRVHYFSHVGRHSGMLGVSVAQRIVELRWTLNRVTLLSYNRLGHVLDLLLGLIIQEVVHWLVGHVVTRRSRSSNRRVDGGLRLNISLETRIHHFGQLALRWWSVLY
jgi:hypothetical protein